MDGKSRWADNIMIERWFRTFKYEEAYLTEWKNIKEARRAIAVYIHKYNFERCHSAIGNVPPASVYYLSMLYKAAKEALNTTEPLYIIIVSFVLRKIEIRQSIKNLYFCLDRIGGT